jgi:thioredoxin-dependent peroxiredoxin
MAKITLKGNLIETVGELPGKGSVAPDFVLVRQDLSDTTLAAYSGKKLLNIFPSLDTSICSASVKNFHEKVGSMPRTVVLHISKDLPFAQSRMCGAEGLQNVETLSAFRSSFAQDYGLEIATGPLKGLCSRCVVVLDGDNRVIYTEQVPEIAQEPDYERAIAVLSI